MAGAGIKLFTQNSVLTAADVNTYLMDQSILVFASDAARTAAFSGGSPALAEGMVSYLKDTDKLYYYPAGGPWTEIGAQVEDGEITTAKIAALAVTAAKIAADAVTTVKILDSNVTTAKIADDAVTSAKIADGAIVNADVNASAAIDLGKLADATIDEKSASYTLALTDKNKFIKMSVTSTANTVTVPTNASVAFPIGSQIHIIQYGTGKTQVIPVSGTVTLYATPGAYLRAQYSSATLLKCDTNIWILMGDLSAS